MTYRDDRGRDQPVKNCDDWAIRRRRILGGMQEAMGMLPDRGHLPPFDVKIVEEVAGQGYRRLTVTFVAETGDRIPADLYLPEFKDGKGKRPAVLALHQTSNEGKRETSGIVRKNQGYARELAERGYVVLAPDYPSFGDYRYDFNSDRYASGTMKGIFNHMRCVDYLQSRPEVDPERLGVIGHSLGGHNAMFVAAFDDRLKVVVSCCGWTPFHDYYGGKLKGWSSDRYMPRIEEVYGLHADKMPFDFYEIVAALAPRPFFSISPQHDDNFDVTGVRKAMIEAKRVYQMFGAGENLHVIHPDCGHDFPPEARRTAYEFIDRALAFKPPQEAASVPVVHVNKEELPRIPPKAPTEALSTFQVVPGFRIEQVAAEPLVQSPVAATFDENGRLFVVEMIDYSEQGDAHLGRIRLLEDLNNDGKFDKATVFVDHLSWPTAILCSRGGVYVGAPPDLFYFKDTDADGRADLRQTVFTGFSRANVQGLLNSLRWGLDNRIHGATSTSGGTVRRPESTTQPVSLNGRDFSFDPVNFDLTPTSGGAQHGMCFDDWGRKFACSNSDHIQIVMYEDRYIARNPYLSAPGARLSIAADGPQAEVYRISPVEPWRTVRTRLRAGGFVPGLVEGGGRAAGYFTGATGTTIYRGDAFPESYRDQAFVGDVGGNIVHRKILEPKGVTWVARRADDHREFVASTDIWFRPVQFMNAPDGALYLLDMYREVIEHPASLPPAIKTHLDLTSGRDRGRIYRIVPDNFRQPGRVPLGSATAAELVTNLEKPNAWHRETASRLLFERQDPSTIPALETLARESRSPLGRLHSLYALSGLKALKPAFLLNALDDPQAEIREHAIRLSEPFLNASPELRSKILGMTADKAIRVRYQLAFTLGELSTEDRIPALASIARSDADDPWVRLALLSSVVQGANGLLIKLLDDTSFRTSFSSAELLYRLAEQVGLHGSAEEGRELMNHLDKLPEGDPGVALKVIRGLQGGLDRGQPALKVILFPEGSRAAGLVRSLLATARSIAVDVSRSRADRIDATRTLSLGRFMDMNTTLTRLLDQRQPPELRSEAIATLGRFPDAEVGRILVDAWPTLGPGLRSKALETIFSRKAWIITLLQGIDAGRLIPTDIDPGRLRALESDSDETIRNLVKTLATKLRPRRRADVLKTYEQALTTQGDRDRGKLAFEKACASCHRLEGKGYEVGPSLLAIKNRGPAAILANVLDPNAEVNPQYVNYVCLTRDGRSVSGMIASESATAVIFRRGGNEQDTVLRRDIDDLKSSGLSIMPEGLEHDLGVTSMADLLAYLMTVD